MRGPREMSVEYPITPGVRQLRELGIEFEPHVFDYVEKGEPVIHRKFSV